MHIAFWSPAWPLEKYQNGIITYVHWMKKELESRGHKISIFTGLKAKDSLDERVHEVRSAFKQKIFSRLFRLWAGKYEGTYDFASAISAAILRVHRDEPIDVIEMEESFGWFKAVALRTSIPVLVKLHGPAFLSLVEDEVNTDSGREKIKREGLALAGWPVLISPSNSTLVQTTQKYGLIPKVGQVIANPLNMDANVPLWRLEGCDQNAVLFVGRFDKRKGADVVLQAFLAILSRRPNLKLIFVGPDRGWREPDGSLTRLQTYVERLFPAELRDRIEYRGEVANHEAARLRTTAMVTIIASRWENQSYAVLEAMFQGCPVVCSDAGGCPESVIDGMTGRLAKSGDPEDFAVKIGSVLADPQLAQKMGEAARGNVMAQHSASKIADETLEMYSKIVRHTA